MSSTVYSYLKTGIYGKVDSNAFYKSSKRKKSKSRGTKSTIESILNIGSHKQQCLVLNNTLTHF